MSGLLRRPQSIARSSRQLLKAASLSRTLAQRPASLPRPLYAYARSRQYSTEKENDDKQVDKKSGSQPKGMENLYSQQSPLSSDPQQPGKKPEEPDDGKSKLTAAEEKALEDTFALVKKGMPASMAADIDKALKKIKREGLPAELRETIAEVSRVGMSPARAAKLWRLTTHIARQTAEDVVNEKHAEPQQKTSDNPGPAGTSGTKDSGKKKEGQSPFGAVKEVKFDLSNFLVSAFVAYMLYRLFSPTENSREITWQEFRNTFFDKGLVEKLVVINGNQVRVYLHRENVAAMYPESPASQQGFYYYFSIGSVEAFERRVDEAQNELGIPSSERIPVSYTQEGSWANLILGFGPSLLFIGAITYMSRRAASGGGAGGGVFGMGKSRAKKFNHETDIKVKFSDVAGMDEAKTEIMEFVGFLKDPARFQKLGAKIPRGAILSGPPGTGKTLLAKATAGESGVPFFSVSGSEFVEMFVGVGPSRVRDLFANARKNTPCIIFIDEIDAIGKARAKSSFGGGNDERESTLNQILTEMDGFNTSEQVVVLAGTNRADVLDKALMRPGRFDRHIAIDRPTMEGRKQIFGVHLKSIVTNEDMEHLKGRLSALTPGFAGADIANCVNEAALVAARAAAESVTMEHFEKAIERVIGGLEKKSLVLTPEEKKTVAYHEAGHAICGWYFQWADPLLKVSIIPRGAGALGYAQYLPGGGNDAVLMNVKQLMDRMAMTLGGRVSEELHFDTVTSGASDDFNKVTRMATAMVTKWGMSNLGYIYYPSSGETQETQLQKPFSEQTAQNIDAEVKRIVNEAYKQCRQLLEEKKREVGLVAEELLKKEMIDRDDMVRLLGKRPWADPGEFSKYFSGSGDNKPLGPAPGTPPTGGIGDSDGGSVPPPLPGAGPAPPAPALYKQLDDASKRW